MLSVKQVADHLSISTSKVRQLIDSGLLKAVNIGLGKNRIYRISESDLVEMLDSMAVKNQPAPKKGKRISVEEFV